MRSFLTVICIKLKCHSLAFNLQKDLIILVRFLDAKNIASYVPGFLAVLQLFTGSAVAYPEADTAEYGGIVCHQYQCRANFLNGSALFSLYSSLRYEEYPSCSRILALLLKKALRTPSGSALSSRCMAGHNHQI